MYYVVEGMLETRLLNIVKHCEVLLYSTYKTTDVFNLSYWIYREVDSHACMM